MCGVFSVSYTVEWQVQDLCFFDDGSRFLSCNSIVGRDSPDRTIMVWDFSSAAVLSSQIFQVTCSLHVCLWSHVIFKYKISILSVTVKGIWANFSKGVWFIFARKIFWPLKKTAYPTWSNSMLSTSWNCLNCKTAWCDPPHPVKKPDFGHIISLDGMQNKSKLFTRSFLADHYCPQNLVIAWKKCLARHKGAAGPSASLAHLPMVTVMCLVTECSVVVLFFSIYWWRISVKICGNYELITNSW